MHLTILTRLLLPLLFFSLLPPVILAEVSNQEVPEQTVGVAVSHCPPFVIKQGEKVTGIGIYLWDRIAEEMGVTSDYVELPFGDLLKAIAKEERDSSSVIVGLSCISITVDREKVVDFSHSFHETYTGIAVRERQLSQLVSDILLNHRVWRALLLVFGFAVLVGAVFFFLEGGRNPKLYSMKTPAGRTMEAFILGLLFITRGPIRYYEFTTMTARMLSAILAIASTFMIAGITAVLASAFTLESLSNRVTGLEDLRNVSVGALEASTSSQLLTQNGIPHSRLQDLEPMLDKLDAGALDAIVADAAFLKYAIKEGREQGKYFMLSVLPDELEHQNYGIAMEPESHMKEAVNQALLKVRKSDGWRQKVKQYLGE